MSILFEKSIFPEYREKEVMKSCMDGFGDPTLRDFSLLDLSVIKKAEFKEDSFEREFIDSFLHAAKELAVDGDQAINRRGSYVIYSYSYTLPIMFLVRHCMELSIKRAIRRLGHEPRKIHGLQELWNSLLSRFPEQIDGKDRETLFSMGKFVEAIADIDNNGVDLRYFKNRQGELTQDRPLFVNNRELVAYLEKFVDQLESISHDVPFASEK